ncbi:hypothetical protein WH43_10200 [Rheinheimera sp. KL1]|uniref:TDP-N-acetylfucosamine:lipid II N-acetylfucosaminyltransferase n=1 Tax=Rheinheimera sp. KL1 TaxID=1635005 RepID=UPI0006A97B03|nr:TDP-N-acetylfucosamine:lipid II N-acetylfucosaminyltransferase [Rheinheimera sp. KL1]KOO58150.1 hypothetical protein WH43_10200 [Rheinheimera sp. KL1]
MILHVMILEKFLPPFIEFVDKNFGRGEHKYVFVTSEKYLFGLTPEHEVEFLHTDHDIFVTLSGYMRQARKIILHGLWRDKVDLLLLSEPEFCQKSYWIMWGGDFYFPSTHSRNRHEVIQRIANLITSATKDVELVYREYKAIGKHIPCVCYTSNIFNGKLQSFGEADARILVLVGNSATATNNHLEIFNRIQRSTHNDNIHIYCPLSYGDKEYTKKITEEGERVFGYSFTPITSFMHYEEYLRFLNKVDIAIFDHERQQAFGVIIQLLGFGKKVFMNVNSSLYHVLSNMGITLYDSSAIELSLIDKDVGSRNADLISKNYSESALVRSLSSWIF